jgi:thiosulfate dehydrogenase [quinone] large subunit
MDDHLIYAAILAVLALTAAGDTIGLGTWWSKTVGKHTWLK